MEKIRSGWGSWQKYILIGGMIGCRNDCYRPAEGLSTQDAYDFHSWQVKRLVDAEADFLIAETLPAVPEAVGIARAISRSGIPYMISFVINREGNILDGNTLEYAFNEIDTVCDPPPVGYMISCAYPSFIHADKQPDSVVSRLIGYLANASSLDLSELDGASTLKVDDISDWGNRMIELNSRYGVKILGGCCGTDTRHLQYIVDNIGK
jgi:S-methylmethionine-dependent homocysteine/selenocysteine methylase